jgi:hypothetical protein
MKYTALLAFAVSAINQVMASPVNTDPNTAGNVVAGVASHASTLLIGGPLWLNGAISGSVNTFLNSTPAGIAVKQLPSSFHNSVPRTFIENTIL